MSIRPQDVLFYGGGECLQRFGVPFWRMTRSQDVAATVARSGAVGPFIDKDGIIRQASANRLRTDWIDTDGDGILDTPTLLMEDARTNLNTDDDPANWNDVATVTSGIDDPEGGTDAYTIEDSSAVSTDSRYFTPSFSVDGSKSVCFVVRERVHAADGTGLLVRDQTAGEQRLHLQIAAWTDGEPTTITEVAGTFLGKRELVNGWWAIFAETTSVTSANAHRVIVFPATDLTDPDATLTGSIDLYRANVLDGPAPHFSIFDASETKNADTLYADFPAAPQEMTIYVRFVELMPTPFVTGFIRVGQIGNAADTGARLQIMRNGGASSYRAGISDGTNTRVISVDGSPSFGDDVELRIVVAADSSMSAGVAVNGGSETTGSVVALPAGLPSEWGDTRFYLNSIGSSAVGAAQFRSVKVVRGATTMAEMRSLFAYDSARAVA